MAISNFVWSGDKAIVKHGVMAWSWVCAPYEEGGMGVRSIRAVNESHLFKLAWNILVVKTKD